nr:12308_t:CDS:2 [Entrophospora candida]
MIYVGIRSITLGEIYGQHIIGPEGVLNHNICIQDTINTIEYHEQPSLIPKNDSKEFIRPELNRRCVEVICSEDTDIGGYQEIDATTGRYIIKIRRRCHSADAILSHADEQYKYSEALESGYLVHEDILGEIDANDVKKEEVKTHATGAERLVIVTPKRFKEGDEQLIPRNCAIVSGNDFVNLLLFMQILFLGLQQRYLMTDQRTEELKIFIIYCGIHFKKCMPDACV